MSGYKYAAVVYGSNTPEAGCVAVWQSWLAYRPFEKLPLKDDRLNGLQLPFGITGAELWALIPEGERRHPGFSVWQTRGRDGANEEAALVVHPDEGSSRVVVRWAYTSPPSFGKIVESLETSIFDDAAKQFSFVSLLKVAGGAVLFWAALYFCFLAANEVKLLQHYGMLLAFGLLTAICMTMFYQTVKIESIRRVLKKHPVSIAIAQWRKDLEVLKPKPAT